MVRRVREAVLKAGGTFRHDNVFAIELDNGSRVLALPGSDDSVRGLTVDAWIVADEAARLSPDLIAALRPMRAQKPDARLAMLSTAWTRSDPFWKVWDSGDAHWIRIRATADTGIYDPVFLEQERAALGEHAFNREYLGIPGGEHASPFTWELFETAMEIHVPRVPPVPPFRPQVAAALRILEARGTPARTSAQDAPCEMDDPRTWGVFKPLIIAHDVGSGRDSSTAVVGGNGPFQPPLLGILDVNELPQKLYGSARARALAQIDQRYQRKALIVADLSHDPTYAEVLYEAFGKRVVGLHISRHGDGMSRDWRPIKDGGIYIYRVGRSYLLDLFHSRLQSRVVRMVDEPMTRRACQQLVALESDARENEIIYKCPSGQHDDLGISCAMLAWAATHPHLPTWVRELLSVSGLTDEAVKGYGRLVEALAWDSYFGMISGRPW